MTYLQVGTGIRVERRSPEDLPACVHLLRSVHLEDHYPVMWPAEPAQWLSPSKQIASWIARDATAGVVGHVAVSSVGNHPAGDAWRVSAGMVSERLLVLSRLFVAPTHRREGLGESLITAATLYARERGVLPVLDVAQTNVAAIRLYERLRWRRVGDLDVTTDRKIPVFAYLGPIAGVSA